VAVEGTVEVEFNDEEEADYAVLNKAARNFYMAFKDQQGRQLSKHSCFSCRSSCRFGLLLRIAASGGRIPLDGEGKADTSGEAVDDAKNNDSNDDESVVPKKKWSKREKPYSEFAYLSKLRALLSELKSAREEDPNGELVCCSCP